MSGERILTAWSILITQPISSLSGLRTKYLNKIWRKAETEHNPDQKNISYLELHILKAQVYNFWTCNSLKLYKYYCTTEPSFFTLKTKRHGLWHHKVLRHFAEIVGADRSLLTVCEAGKEERRSEGRSDREHARPWLNLRSTQWTQLALNQWKKKNNNTKFLYHEFKELKWT